LGSRWFPALIKVNPRTPSGWRCGTPFPSTCGLPGFQLTM
jgi:hypothetical protein